MKLINRPIVTTVSVAALLLGLAGCETLHLKPAPKTAGETGAEAATHSTATLPSNVPAEHKFDSVWDHIRAGYGLPEASNSAVDAQIRFYTSNKAYFYKITQQSEPY